MSLWAGWTSLAKAGILCFSLVFAPNCATQKIVGNEFIHEVKGYSFVLPGMDWEIDSEAWRNERDFGYILVRKRPKSRIIKKNRNRSGSNTNDLEIRPLPVEEYEKLLLDMDAGFRHKTHAGKILVGTILERDLIKFLKADFVKTDSDLPENLIAGYMERLRDFYPPYVADPSVVTFRTLPQSGPMYRMQWVAGQGLRILYGVSLNREFLFISLEMNRKAPASAIEAGLKTLDQLVESIVIPACK